MREFHPEASKKWLPLMPDQVWQLGSALGLEQGWGLFAPEPGRRFGWYVLLGTKKNGEQVDVLTGQEPNYDRPEFLTISYASSRWRKLWMNLPETRSYPYLIPGLTRFYLEKWNREHEGGDQLQLIEVYWMRDVTVPYGQTPPPVDRIRLYWFIPKRETTEDQWLVIVGKRATDGKPIDMLRDGIEVNWKKPDPAYDPPIVNVLYPEYARLVGTDWQADVLPGLTRGLLKKWNEQQKEEKRVKAIEVWLLKREPGNEPTHELLDKAEVEAKNK
jgi:hypothetical protein